MDGIADIDDRYGGRDQPRRRRGSYDRVGGLPHGYYPSPSSEGSWTECSGSSSWCSFDDDDCDESCCCCCCCCCGEDEPDDIRAGRGCGTCDRGCNGNRDTRREEPTIAQGYTVIQNHASLDQRESKPARAPETRDARSWESPPPREREREREALRMEDVIYYLAQRERHRNNERRRIQDWMRVMGDLDGEERGGPSRRDGHGRDDREGGDDGRRSRGGGHRLRRREGTDQSPIEDEWYRDEPEGRHERAAVPDDRRRRRREEEPRESWDRVYDTGERHGRGTSRERLRPGPRYEPDYGYGFRRR